MDRRAHTLTQLQAAEPVYRESVDRVLRGLRDRLVVVEGGQSGSGSGAPVGASYVTIAANATLSAERTLTAGAGISVVDGGANSSVTIATTITQYTDEMARDAIGAALVEGHAIDITVVDGSDTITVAVDQSELTFGTPVAIGPTLAAGAATTLSRSDHVHTVSLESISRTIREINFSGLATNAFTNGTESVDGTNGTVAGSANAGTNWGIVNGQGLRCDAPTSTASVWSHASPNGPSIEFVLSDLIPTYDPGVGPLLIEAYVSSSTTENTGDRLILGLRRAAGTPITGSGQVGRYAVRQGEGAGVTQLASFDGATITSVTNANIAPQNTLTIRCRDSESAVMTGTYSGGWGTRSMVYRNNSDVGNNGSLLYPQTRLVIAFAWASDASPTSTFTIERLRLSYAI